MSYNPPSTILYPWEPKPKPILDLSVNILIIIIFSSGLGVIGYSIYSLGNYFLNTIKEIIIQNGIE